MIHGRLACDKTVVSNRVNHSPFSSHKTTLTARNGEEQDREAERQRQRFKGDIEHERSTAWDWRKEQSRRLRIWWLNYLMWRDMSMLFKKKGTRLQATSTSSAAVWLGKPGTITLNAIAADCLFPLPLGYLLMHEYCKKADVLVSWKNFTPFELWDFFCSQKKSN